MARDYGITTNTVTEERDILVDNFPMKQYSGRTIAQANKVLKRGTPLGIKTEDGKYYELDTTAEDGTQTLAAILVNDVDVTDGEEIATVYITGTFNANAIYLASSIEVTPGTYKDAGLIFIEEDHP